MKHIDQQGMKIKNNNYWSTGNEVRTTTTDQQGMKLEQQLLTNNYWSTGNEVRTTPIDQQRIKLEQQILINELN